MQRYHLTLWLALVAALWSTQCDSLSDDCKKTLTCGDAGAPVLNPRDCIWRFPDGGVWTDGPQFVNGMWQWPNGEPAPAFECSPLQGQGGSGGASDNCTNSEPAEPGRTQCDPRVCDPSTLNCVECLVSADCAAKSDVATTGKDVCDTITHRCVRCLEPRDCSGDTPFCFVDMMDVTRSACVECLSSTNCTNSEQCDERTHECSLACSAAVNDCAGDKPFCDTVGGVCVECLADAACSGGTSQCNTDTHQCVQCRNDTPCTPIGRVCDINTSTCVACIGNDQCTDTPETPSCDPASSSCVECLSNDQCLSPTESRCNVGSHTCEICTADNQCEMGAPRCRPGDGRCVVCLSDVDCPMGDHCDIPTGSCASCVSDDNCITATAARCDLTPGALTFHQCVGCNANPQCSNKSLPPLCRVGDGTCVNCLSNSECKITGPATSQCGNGTCVACADDDDCDLFTTENLRACRTNIVNPGCVECTGDGNCINDPDGRACKLVDTPTDGPAPINTCVECIDNSDCSDPEFSRCVQNQCEPCVANGDCANLVSGERVCDRSGGDGVCVECTGQQRAACGAFVCDSATRQCTSIPANSAANCATCVSDDHCVSSSRCLQQTFGVTNVGFFCFPLQAGGVCPRGFGQLTSATTIDDELAAVCLQRETTCPAFVDYGELQTCLSEADDAACGVTGLADGACVPRGAGFVCSINCEFVDDCPAGICTAGVCPQQ